MNREQSIILGELAKWGDAFPCLSQLCLFGSVARGDAHPGSDVDVFVIYEAKLEAGLAPELMTNFAQWQASTECLASNLGELVGRKVNIHGAIVGQHDDARKSVNIGRRTPVVYERKAVVVYTPPKHRI